MFQTLSDRLNGVLDKLTRRGSLSEADVGEAMREVRRALLEADVALNVVKDFVEKVKAKAIGQAVLKSVTPGQMVVKIVHDELVAMLGSDAEPVDLAATPPVAILMVGLQGSGKTTSTAKIAYRLKTRDRKKVLMASLDTRRPAAMEQLRVLGEQTQVDTLPIVAGQTPVQIARRARDAAKLGGYDVVLLDTAGRVTVDDELMREVADVKRDTNPHEVLLVADSLTGQDAVNTATAFDGQVGITGIVLTRADGDGRGGAALSMRAVTGKPIKLIGVGEKWDALEDFDPKRIAGRILGMGDVVGLVEKAIQNVDMQKAQEIAQKMRKGAFDLEDLSDQLKQMEKMGGMGGLMGMMPGVAKLKSQINEAGLEKELKRQRAIISSMTPHERRNPKVLNAKRKKRIAAGSGTTPADINKLLKMHLTMADMMKKMRGKGGLMSKMMGGMGGGGMFGMGGGGAAPSAAELAKMKEELSKLDPRALEQLPQEVKDALEQAGGGDAGGAGAGALPKGLPGGLPGLGGMGGMPKLPGLGGGGLPGLGGPRFPMMPGKKKK
ncbi:MAG: signal recognition particle protein [Hyphomicrobiaceae bacterium]|nr:signal recognition particle protein [Hyphomicrobiaceae bacterium]